MSDIPYWCQPRRWVDVSDSGQWRAAKVLDLEKDSKLVLVSLDGYGARWNEWVPIKKIAPFRFKTQKYTGPLKHAERDWIFAESDVLRNIAIVRDLIKVRLRIGNAFELTQRIRGDIYTYLECLLTWKYTKEKDKALAVEYFTDVLNLVLMFLSEWTLLSAAYKQGLQDFNLQLTHEEVALAHCWPEIISMLNRLFALDTQCSQFFLSNDTYPTNYRFIPESISSVQRYSKTLLYIINLFVRDRGFNLLYEILPLCPLEMIDSLPVYYIAGFLTRSFGNDVALMLGNKMKERIIRIEENEVKEVNLETVTRVIENLKLLYREHVSETQFVELQNEILLNLSASFLKSQFLEKRIKGLNEINRILQSQERRKKLTHSGNTIGEWINEQRLVEYILQRPHEELIKRISPLLIFLAKAEVLDDQHILLLWNCTREKHQTLSGVSYQALNEITAYLKKSQYEILFRFLKELPETEYTPDFLNLLKEFTLRAIENDNKSIFGVATPKEYYGLPVFESLMLDSSPINLWDEATECLSEILSLRFCVIKREATSRKCIEFIESNNSAPQALKLLYNFFKPLSRQRMKRELEGLNVNMVNIVVSSLVKYYDSCYILEISGDPYTTIYQGHYTHEQHLRYRLRFIELLHNAGFQIGIEEITVLWNMMMMKPLSYKDSNLFLEWLSEGLEMKPMWSLELLTQVFQSLFMEIMYFSRYDIDTPKFKAFLSIFLTVNSQNMKYSEFNIIDRYSEHILGEDALLDILLSCENFEVAVLANQVMIQLYIKMNPVLDVQRIWHERLNCILEVIKLRKDTMTARALNLISGLIDEFPEVELQDKGLEKCIHVRTEQEKDFRKVFIGANETIRNLRLKISKLYQQPLNKTILRIHNKYYDNKKDNLSISTLNFHTLEVDFRSSCNELYGKVIVSNHPDIIDTLLELLSDPRHTFTDVAWSILMKLPTHPPTLNALENLNKPINQLLNPQSLHWLLYCFAILDKLKSDPVWVNKFLSKGGIDHLLSLFLQQTDIRQGKIQIKYETHLLKLLAMMLPKSRATIPPSRLVLKTLDSLFMFTQIWIDARHEDTDIKEVLHSIKVLLELVHSVDPAALFYTINNYANMDQLLAAGLIYSSDISFSSSLANLFSELCKDSLRYFLIKRLSDLTQRAISEVKKTDIYWELYIKFLQDSQDITQSYKYFLGELFKRVELSSDEKDSALWGILKILTMIEFPNKDEVSEYLISDCLFKSPTPEAPKVPFCKHPATRAAAFELLRKLCNDDTSRYKVMTYLDGIIHTAPWRTAKMSDWAISSKRAERSHIGFVGLKNLGCTCYMNSVMQQLFMIPTFREAVLQVSAPEMHPSDNLLYQFQKIFASLKYSQQRYFNPKGFCTAFRDWEGNPINPAMQMDVDEFFSLFMDRLELTFQNTHIAGLIQEHFGGTQVTELIGRGDCQHRNEREEPFLAMPLQVKGFKSVQESLAALVAGEVLEGDNAYQCDSCSNKVRAVRRTCLKHLPNVLILVLRRFEFDYDTMTRGKVNEYCEFPTELNMEPYTQEGLERKENPDFISKYPSDYYHYKLKGIIVHTGTAESGHYYSFIQDRSCKAWYEYNDTIVRNFHTSDIPEEAFGGDNQAKSVKNRNAYVVFYERDKLYSPRRGQDHLQPLNINLKEGNELMNEVQEENNRFWKSKHMFANECIEFVLSLSSISQEQVRKFIFKFFVTTYIRARDRRNLQNFISLIESWQDLDIMSWISDAITRPQSINELLLTCQDTASRHIILYIIQKSLHTQFDVSQIFIRMVSVLPLARKPKRFAQYYDALYSTTLKCLDKAEEVNLPNRLLAHLLNEEIKLKPLNVVFSYEDSGLGKFKEEGLRDEDMMFFDDQGQSYASLASILHSLMGIMNNSERKILESSRCMLLFTSSVDSKLAAKTVTRLYYSVTRDDINSSSDHVRLILQGLKDSSSRRRRYWFWQISNILSYQDMLQDRRVDLILSDLLKYAQERSTISDETEEYLKFITELGEKILAVQRYLEARKLLLSWVDTWLDTKANALPRDSNAKKEYVDFKKRWRYMLITSPPDMELDEEKDRESVPVGTVLDIFDTTYEKWFKGRITKKVGNIVEISYTPWKDNIWKWMPIASDNIILPDPWSR